MAKTTAPLLSFGGSGQIGKTQVYSSWRGVKYARRYVIPSNPRSDAQTETRGAFAWLVAVWKQLPPAVQDVWTLFAKGRPLTNRNALIKSNLAALRGTTLAPVTTLDGLIMSPGANAGLAADGIAATDGGTHHLAITLTAPTLPAGWAIVKAHFIAFKQQDAKTDTAYTPYYDSDDTSPYTALLAGFGAGTYEALGFFEYTKPDGSTAYSPSLSQSQVVA